MAAEVGVTASVTAGRDESVSVTRGQDIGVTTAETVTGVEQASLTLGLAVGSGLGLLGRLVVGGQTVRA